MKISKYRDEYMKLDAEGQAKLLGKVYGLIPDKHYWRHKQSNKWIIGKGGTEMIAAIENIVVDITVEHMSRDFVCLSGVAHWENEDGSGSGERVFACAHQKNCNLDYYPEMSEKRLKQRSIKDAVLRDVGGAGTTFYGEDEAEDFKQSGNQSKPTNNKKEPEKAPTVGELASGLNAATSMVQVKGIAQQVKAMDLSQDDLDFLTDLASTAKARIAESDAA